MWPIHTLSPIKAPYGQNHSSIETRSLDQNDYKNQTAKPIGNSIFSLDDCQRKTKNDLPKKSNQTGELDKICNKINCRQ